MKYLLKHLDSSRHVLMKEIVDSKGDVEYVLRQTCENDIKRRKDLFDRLRERIPWIGQSDVKYRIEGREGILYYMEKTGEESIVGIHVCTPIGFPFRRRATRVSIEG